MKNIFETYGHFMLEGMTVVLVLGFLFSTKDNEGNQGVLKLLGGVWNQGYEDILWDTGFMLYEEEAAKAFPSVVFAYDNKIYVNEPLPLLSFLRISGNKEQSLRMKVLDITDSAGTIKMDCYNEQTGTVCFPTEGIYKLKLSVKDASNKKYSCAINVPVSRRGYDE